MLLMSSRSSRFFSRPAIAARPAGLYQSAMGSSAPATKAPPRPLARTPIVGRVRPPAWALAAVVRINVAARPQRRLVADIAFLHDLDEAQEAPLLLAEEVGDGPERRHVVGRRHGLALVAERVDALHVGDGVDDLAHRGAG